MTAAGPFVTRVPDFWRDQPWEEWTRRWGSPLFVFSQSAIQTQIERYQAAFAGVWPKTHWAWSYKTNYLPEICQIFHAAGAGAEVVSGMEFDLATSLQVPGERIVFNGPHKPREALQRAVAAGALVNIDHLTEIEILSEIARDLGRVVEVGLRLNLNPADSPWARFGCDIATGQAKQAAELIAKHGNLKLTTLHTHLGTMIPKPGRYGSAVRRLGEFAKELRQARLAEITAIDLGGGFPSSILPFDNHEWAAAPIELYARDIAAALKGAFGAEEPTLILEAGRALIDDAAVLVSTIVGEKNLPDGRRGYFLDAGINVLPLAAKQRFHLLPLRIQPDSEVHRSVLYGPLCLPTDCLAADVMLPKLSRGERFLFWPVGAYNVTMMSPFIEYRPAVVLLDKDQQPQLIRPRDQLGDVVRMGKE